MKYLLLKAAQWLIPLLACFWIVQLLVSAFTSPPPRKPTIEQVQTLSELTTLRADVADIQVTEIKGYTGGVKAAILIKGDVRLSVDLSKAKFEAIDYGKCTATLLLPQPQMSDPRVDHARTKLFALYDHGLWQMVPGDMAQTAVMNKAYHQAQEIVGHVKDEPELKERARKQAEKVLTTFFEAMGWYVHLRWS